MNRSFNIVRRFGRMLADLLLTMLVIGASAAADWPMYRADSARSGYTAETLPETLELEWVYHARHKPAPAWPDRQWQRMAFDFAYQPVVAEGTVYYGGSVDCEIHALDAATGRARWSFTTDGPVRFAPAVWRDRVFAVSDDGYLYCLAAADGRLLWRVRGGPSDMSVLGNGRMISMFPARGGLVIHDDVVYFGAGIFPTQGFFLHAVDPQSGQVLWTNGTSGNTRLYNYNHGFCYSNVAAQGYLALAGDTLLVSTGRSIPAAFRRSDGHFLHWHPLEVYRTGGDWVMAADDYFFNGDMAFHVGTGAVACPEMGVDPSEGTASSVSPQLREVTMIEGAVTPELILVANGRAVRAIDRKRPFVDSEQVVRKFCTSRTAIFFAGSPRTRLSQKLQGVNLLWTAPMECPGAFIAAGNRAYAGGAGVVSALELNTKKVVWTAEVEGTAYGLAAANGRLYASTDQGLIYCFGSGAAQAKVIRPAFNEHPYPENDLYAKAAEEILRKTGITEGYCLDLGCGDGQLACALAKRSQLQIYAVDGDAENVASARKALVSAGLYGARVTVHHLDPADTGYPPYFANLIASGRSVTEGPGVVPTAEWHRLQRPCGGTICIGKPGTMKTDVRGPLESGGVWTHSFGTAANSGTSDDTVARGPLGFLWFGTSGPGGMAGGKQRTSAPLYVDGRLYIPGQRFLRCLDAYNGRVMWENQGYANRGGRHYTGAHTKGANICADKDRVYFLSQSGECVFLDGRTGEELKRCPAPPAPDGKPGTWGFLACNDGILFGTLESGPLDTCFEDYCRPLGQEFTVFKTDYHWHTEGISLFALDAENGELRWTYRAKDLIPHNGIAIGGGRVYLIDRPNLSLEVAQARRRGQPAPVSTSAGSLVALDAKTGRQVWRHDKDVFGTLLALSVEHDTLVMGFPVMRRGNFVSDLFTRLAVHRAADGRRLWSRDVRYHQRPLIVGRSVVVDPGGFDWTTGKKSIPTNVVCAWDLLTGQPKTRKNPVTGQTEPWTFGRTEKCSGWTGSPNLLLYRTGTISYYDFLRDEGRSDMGGIRPSCYINVFAAGGLVFAPDNSSGCTCSYLHRTSIALRPLSQQEHWGLFMGERPRPGVIQRLALNIGAIGDRRGPDGTLWLALPRPSMGITTANKVDARAFVFDPESVSIQFGGAAREEVQKLAGLRPTERPPLSWPGGYSDVYRPSCLYHLNTETAGIVGSDLPWVFSSGSRGALAVTVNVQRMPPSTAYKVRLYFAEVEDVGPGGRVFDVLIGRQTVLDGFDVLREAGGKRLAVVKEFVAVAENGVLTVSLEAKQGEPILSGLEIMAAEE